MAHKLNLVKTRILSSLQDLDQFKREATEALLKFADSNDVDLDAVSKTLQARYKEIEAALISGDSVESEVEIFPQEPATPSEKTAGAIAGPGIPDGTGPYGRGVGRGMKPQLQDGTGPRGRGVGPGRGRTVCPVIKEKRLPLQEPATPPGTQKKACMQKPVTKRATSFEDYMEEEAEERVERRLPMYPVWPPAREYEYEPTQFKAGDKVKFAIPFDKLPEYDPHRPNLLAPGDEDHMVGETGQIAELRPGDNAAVIKWDLGDSTVVGIDQLEPIQSFKKACMQKPVTAAIGADPDAAMEDVQITAEDIARMLAESPEKQAVAASITRCSSVIGANTAWALLMRLATNQLADNELRDLKAALHVLAAAEDEENPEQEESAVATEKPGKNLAESVFSEPGEMKAADSLVNQFNKLITEIDPDGEMLSPISLDEISRQMETAASREREGIEVSPEEIGEKPRPAHSEAIGGAPGLPVAEEHFGSDITPILPQFDSLSAEDKAAITEGLPIGEHADAIDQWYGEMGLNVDEDMQKGVAEYLKSKGMTDASAQDIMAAWEASGDKGHITPQQIKQFYAEIITPQKPAEQPKDEGEAEQTELPMAEPEGEPAPVEKAPSTSPIIQTVKPGELTELYGEEYEGRYTAKVVDPHGKILGWYADASTAKMAHPDAVVKE